MLGTFKLGGGLGVIVPAFQRFALAAQFEQAGKAFARIRLGHPHQEPANPATGLAHEGFELGRAFVAERLVPAKAEQELRDPFDEQVLPFGAVHFKQRSVLDPEQQFGLGLADPGRAFAASAKDQPLDQRDFGGVDSLDRQRTVTGRAFAQRHRVFDLAQRIVTQHLRSAG